MVADNKLAATRRGFSAAEAITGIVVMSLAIVILGRFAAGVSRGLSERELATRIGWQTESARAELGTWSYEDITAENIAQRLGLSDSSLVDKLQSPKWTASVEEIEQPILAKRVHLSLACVYNAQAVTPSELTFWVPKPASESAASNAAANVASAGEEAPSDAATKEGSDES